jgi:hypothetical protein
MIDQRITIEHLLKGSLDVRERFNILINCQLAYLKYLLEIELGIQAKTLKAMNCREGVGTARCNSGRVAGIMDSFIRHSISPLGLTLRLRQSQALN